VTTEQYDEVLRRLNDEGDWPPDGLEYHVCFGPDDDLRAREIWDSKEQLEAFGERLMPMLKDAGIDVGPPEILEVHNIVRRS
jgi:hypothetical protein